jgi:RNA polymerase sigma-70 factor, ECF subfamily
MDFPATVVERTYQPDVVEQRPLFPRKAIDPDAALVEQMRRGDAGAVEALVGAYGDRVYRLAIRITGNASDAEEIAQDALWTASRKIDTFRGTAAFGSWVYRITANTAYQKLRRMRTKRNEVSWEDLAPSFDDRGQHIEVAVDWSRRLKDPAIEGELKGALCRAIDELPADYRMPFLSGSGGAIM